MQDRNIIFKLKDQFLLWQRVWRVECSDAGMTWLHWSSGWPGAQFCCSSCWGKTLVSQSGRGIKDKSERFITFTDGLHLGPFNVGTVLYLGLLSGCVWSIILALTAPVTPNTILVKYNQSYIWPFSLVHVQTNLIDATLEIVIFIFFLLIMYIILVLEYIFYIKCKRKISSFYNIKTQISLPFIICSII